MSLGAALLQPDTLRRSSLDDMIALGEDLARAVAILLEDATAAGPMAQAAERALVGVGERLVASLEPRRRAAETRLRGRIAGPRAEFERLVGEVEGLAEDPAAVIGLLRELLVRLKGLADAATLPAIRAELGFWKTLIEEDLGFSSDFLAGIIADYIIEFRAELGRIAPADLATARRLRLCESVLVRLGLRASQLRPPELDIEPLAREIDAFLRSSGITTALREFSCALDGIEAAMVGLVAVGDAVRQAAQPIGAGVAGLQNSMDYAWYASWLLNDEEVPLLGLSDVTDAKAFLLQLKGTGAVERHIRVDLLQPAERSALDDYEGPAEPSKELMLTILAGINRAMQAGPILRLNFEEDVLSDSQLNEKIRGLRDEYQEEQNLFFYNRRVLEFVFNNKLDPYPDDDLCRKIVLGIINGVAWNRNQVFVTGDRRYVMCDDIPIHVGENVQWHEAPMFSSSEPGQMWFKFDHASPQFCEKFAWILAMAAEAAKAVLHLYDTQPGHEAPAISVAGIEIADTIQQLLFGRPVSAYFLESGRGARKFGKVLDSFFGLKSLATIISTFQSMHSDATGENIAGFWLTVAAGDVVRTIGRTQIANTGRDVLLAGVTLYNFRGPRFGPSELPSNPAWNHRKEAPIVSFSRTLFAVLLISLYPRDNYSRYIWTEDGIGDRRRDMYLGHWVGGSAGLGCLAGLTGSFVAQFIAWGEDFPRFFKAGGKSAVLTFLPYWLLNYLFRENSTDDGRYRAGGGSFRGYPERDGERAGVPRPSPYRLPAPGGTAVYVPQGNLGLFSHNFIANTDFVTPTNVSTQQVYSYDFSLDFRQPIACVRDGTVWTVSEGIADSDTSDANEIVIKHTTIDPVHDDFGRGAVQTYSIYLHLAENGVRDAPAFSAGPPIPMTTTVTQGDLIALAGDTGNSFINHTHIHIVPDNGSGQPDRTFAIPFVFFDVSGDGVPKSLTWYRSGNR